MPIILPTADEIAEMDWRSREKALRRARDLLKDYAYAERLPRLHKMTAEQRAARAAEIAEREAAWGESVRAEARLLAGEGA
jgi:hypothetical protein